MITTGLLFICLFRNMLIVISNDIQQIELGDDNI